LGISDVSHNFYGEIKVKDTIEWNGEYFSGYDEVGGFKNRKMSGVNKVIKIFKELELVWMELDNGKKFIIKEYNKVMRFNYSDFHGDNLMKDKNGSIKLIDL
jgi:hypothetical protein